MAYRYCNKCRALKPPRTHHDSISGRCVLVMDHYCPWMGNAVGYGNYRYFVLFLFYMFTGALYVIFFSSRELFVVPGLAAAEAQAQAEARRAAATPPAVAAGADGAASAPKYTRLAPGGNDEQLVLFVFVLGVAA